MIRYLRRGLAIGGARAQLDKRRPRACCCGRGHSGNGPPGLRDNAQICAMKCRKSETNYGPIICHLKIYLQKS